VNAIAHADHILQLQEDLSSDEMPPEWMWPLWWEMERWLNRIVKERAAKYGSDDNADVDWEENELAAEWKKAM